MSPDSEGLGAAVVAGVGSNLTKPRGISYVYNIAGYRKIRVFRSSGLDWYVRDEHKKIVEVVHVQRKLLY